MVHARLKVTLLVLTKAIKNPDLKGFFRKHCLPCKQVDPTAFYRVLEWLYTGQVKLNVSQCDDVIRLCKQCKLPDLEEEIENALIKADSFGELGFMVPRKKA